MRWRSSHPDSGFFMRSFHLVRTIIVPKFRFLSAGLAALALAACEMQPVVTAPAAPAKSETATEIAAPVATPAVKATAETAGAAPEGVPAIDPDSGPADATTDSSGDTTENVAGKDVAGGDMSADTGEADSGTAADSLRASMTTTAVEAEPAPDKADDTDDPASEPVAETQPENLPTSDDAGNEDTIGDAIAGDETAVTDLALLAPPPPPPPPAELVPSSLVGFSPEQLRARLGEADFTRQEGDMKTWQYRLSDCVVDYFLFPQEGVIRVASWAWRAPVIGLDIDAVACRQALAERDTDSGG